LRKTAPNWSKGYFNGIPAPGGAGLAIVPLCLVLEFGDSVQLPPKLLALWMILIGIMMVSRLPTFALKGWRIEPKWIAPILVIAVLLTAALITNTWLTLSAVGIVYFLSIPCAYISYRRQQKVAG